LRAPRPPGQPPPSELCRADERATIRVSHSGRLLRSAHAPCLPAGRPCPLPTSASAPSPLAARSPSLSFFSRPALAARFRVVVCPLELDHHAVAAKLFGVVKALCRTVRGVHCSRGALLSKQWITHFCVRACVSNHTMHDLTHYVRPHTKTQKRMRRRNLALTRVPVSLNPAFAPHPTRRGVNTK